MAEEKSPSIGSAKSSSEPESPDQLKPFKEPQKALDEAMKGLSQEEWVIKCSAINSIRRLAAHHPEVLCTSQLHTLNLAMITEVRIYLAVQALTLYLYQRFSKYKSWESLGNMQ